MRILLPFFILLLLAPGPALATEEFARETGQECAVCHLDPAGGGELTGAGQGYADYRQQARQTAGVVGPGPLARLLRLAVGYLHLVTAVFWFGTILYVHLILKPSYASSGLPPGEVRVGLVSMAVMAVSGLALTWYRLDSPAALLETRFGVLLLVKVGCFLVMVVTALIAVFVVGPRLRRARTEATPGAGGEFSLEQLATCDGADGHPNYFAYGGRVYDAGASRLWQGGRHMGRHPAGADLTAALEQAPHGEDRILRLPEVGRLVVAAEGGNQRPRRSFFAMAYLNLGLVLAILLVVALWRWG
ncbi:hypothetical protein JCM30471_20320 [Desulfuromonas carbonis]|uniref:CopD family protein n=1 Tax=Desulfuromonas sp. DDH964 TaxID=1823759 RepID=UPI00078DAFF1|nr:CopD family protein [Desulfuromonas sp. DDH964]AMV73614.1 monoheme cytochrome c [Desulfuromonas sp. DDH964]